MTFISMTKPDGSPFFSPQIEQLIHLTGYSLFWSWFSFCSHGMAHRWHDIGGLWFRSSLQVCNHFSSCPLLLMFNDDWYLMSGLTTVQASTQILAFLFFLL